MPEWKRIEDGLPEGMTDETIGLWWTSDGTEVWLDDSHFNWWGRPCYPSMTYSLITHYWTEPITKPEPPDATT